MFNNRQNKSVILVLFLLVSLCVNLQASNSPPHADRKPATLASGTLAPLFDVSTIDNRQISIEDFKGKVTLVIFWATWCRPCKPIIKEVSSLYDQYHLQGFDVVSFSLDKNPEIVRDYFTKQQLPWRNNVWLDGETQNEIAQSYGVSALPTVYLIGRDGRITRSQFLWKYNAKGKTTLGKTPLFADAVKSLLTPEASNSPRQFISCVGGTIALNGVPLEDFSCNLLQIKGDVPGMRGSPARSSEGNYLFSSIPPGQWFLNISLGGMHGVNGMVSSLKELEVLENIQWHNFWLMDGTCKVKCPINDSYVMLIKKWNEKRNEWLVYSQHRQIVSKDRKITNRSNYNFTNISNGLYEYRLCSQIRDNVYIYGGNVEVKSGETSVIEIEKPERNCRVYGEISNFDAKLANPVIFVRNAKADSITLSNFYEMGMWDAVAVVRGRDMKPDGKYECGHLQSGKYIVTAAQFKGSYYGIPVIQQSKLINVDSKNSGTLLDFDFSSQ